MPRTIVPEEQERAQDISSLKSSIRPTPNRTVQVDSDADGQPNFFYWDSNASSTDADGVEIIESGFSTFPDGTSLNGAWKRVRLPFSAATSDDLAEGTENLYYTSERAKNQIQGAGDIQYNENLVNGFDLANANFTNTSFDVSSEDGDVTGITFSKDGLKMFIVGDVGDKVYEYALSTPFDISTANFTVSISISSPTGVEFNDDGTKMYICSLNSKIIEYNLTTGFDISTSSFNTDFDISEDTFTLDVEFNNDGTKMFVIGNNNNSVFEYNLSTGFDLSTASFSGTSFDAGSEDTSNTGVEFNSDGTKMFMVGNDNNSIFEYSLTTGFDISTASFANISFDVSGQETTQLGLTFNNSGSKMFVVGRDSDTVFEYETGTAGGPAELKLDVSELSASNLFGSKTTDDLPEGASNLYFTGERAQDAVGDAITGSGRTTASYDDGANQITVETADEDLQDAVFNNTLSGTQDLISVTYDDANGEVDYVVSDDLAQYDLSSVTTDEISEGSSNLYLTSSQVKGEFQAGGDLEYNKNLVSGFDLSNASFNTGENFNTSTESDPRDIAFNSDGSKMFIMGNDPNVRAYDLSTPFDVSTASFNSEIFDTSTQTVTANGLTFNKDGTKMFVTSIGNISSGSGNNVFEYDLTTGFDLTTASYSGNTFISVDSEQQLLNGVIFGDSGSKMYTIGSQPDAIHEYNLNTPFSVTTATYSGESVSTSVTAGITINNDGTKLFATGFPNDVVEQFDLNTPYDLSTASFSTSFDVSGQASTTTGVEFNNTGTKMFVTDLDNSNVYEYSTGSGGGGGPAELKLDVSSLSAADLFGSKTTDNLPEGSNLYFTDERTQDAINAALNGTGGVTISYDDGNNQISIGAAAAATDVSDGGTQVVGDAAEIDFGEGFTAASGGTGTVNVSSDIRFGSETFGGDGIQKEFVIAHGLSSAPAQVLLQPQTDDASGISHKIVDGTNITIVYDTAPPSGTSNIEVNYTARL